MVENHSRDFVRLACGESEDIDACMQVQLARAQQAICGPVPEIIQGDYVIPSFEFKRRWITESCFICPGQFQIALHLN
eukprot:747043-Hanusia_phi.AAC.4